MELKDKNKWIAALRSGKYRQGKDSLFNDGKYCCLGVFCALKGWEMNSGGHSDIYDRLKDYMPLAITTQLVQLNDNENKNFKEIADWIEEHL